jgi:hypothetical protein
MTQHHCELTMENSLSRRAIAPFVLIMRQPVGLPAMAPEAASRLAMIGSETVANRIAERVADKATSQKCRDLKSYPEAAALAGFANKGARDPAH